MSRRSLQAEAGCRAEQRRTQKQLCLWTDLSSRQKLGAERGGLLLEGWHVALAEALVVLRRTDIGILHPVFAQGRDGASAWAPMSTPAAWGVTWRLPAKGRTSP
jgi:hypothetical protein